jgi:hypothetical protein
MSGTFSMRQTPFTNSAAGRMATAAFFAPLMVTLPDRGVPPITSYIAKEDPLLVIISFSQFRIIAHQGIYVK